MTAHAPSFQPTSPRAPAAAPARGLRARGLGLGNGLQTFLHGVSLEIPPGTLTAVIGPSGAGKSILLSLLAGRTRPDEGGVELDGVALEDRTAVARIGYVPQDEIVFDRLTPAENFAFAAALRAETDPAAPLLALRRLALHRQADVPVRLLSGGERKRVNVGLELLHDPPMLILDEPTTGLDPAAAAWLTAFLRELADRGRGVVFSTHGTSRLDLCDAVIVVHGGRIVYHGGPGGLRPFFGAAADNLFERLGTRTALEWREAFHGTETGDARASGCLPKTASLSEVQTRGPAGSRGSAATRGAPPSWRPLGPDLKEAAGDCLRVPDDPVPPRPRPSAFRQFPLLTRRYALCLIRDRWLTGVLVAQAPLLGLLLVLAHGDRSPAGDAHLLFKLSLAAVWFGCINACRELVKERSAFLRDRFSGVGIAPYLAAKLAVLAPLAGLQVALLLATLHALRELPGEAPALAAALGVTAGAGLLMGLALSALVRNSDQALGLVPLALIPQAIFAGVGPPLEGAARTLEQVTVSAWSFRALKRVAEGRPWAEEAAPMAVLALAFLGVVLAGLRAQTGGRSRHE